MDNQKHAYSVAVLCEAQGNYVVHARSEDEACEIAVREFTQGVEDRTMRGARRATIEEIRRAEIEGGILEEN